MVRLFVCELKLAARAADTGFDTVSDVGRLEPAGLSIMQAIEFIGLAPPHGQPGGVFSAPDHSITDSKKHAKTRHIRSKNTG
jgi:hypothetical protein